MTTEYVFKPVQLAGWGMAVLTAFFTVICFLFADWRSGVIWLLITGLIAAIVKPPMLVIGPTKKI
jgi:hypothetical protein